MKVIFEWCNTNSGFFTGISSLSTLLVSVIAIFVSIRTARMPYKKCIKVRPALNFLFEKDLISGKVDSQFDALVVNAVNVGNRNVNVTFLGLAVKVPGEKLQKIQSTNRDLGGKGILEPTKIASVEYNILEIKGLSQFPNNTRVFSCVIDSEGKTYKKYYGKSGKILDNILKL